MWRIIETEEFARSGKWYGKKKSKQFLQVMLNLELFYTHVKAGGRVKPFQFPFLHAEPMDVVAIDQSGGGKLPETRLYVWVDQESETIHLLTMGDKKTQHGDILYCKAYVKSVRGRPGFGRTKGEGHGGEESSEDGG